jgi:hypothetical protein
MQITGFGVDSKGELLICDHGGGALYRLEKTPPQNDAPRFPAKLSETGTLRVGGRAPGRSVAHPLLGQLAALVRRRAQGALSRAARGRRQDRRHGHARLELPRADGAGQVVRARPRGAGRRWVETRLLTKQNGQWAGYSYRWNDEQTEAVLVEARGLDREFKVREAGRAGTTRAAASA